MKLWTLTTFCTVSLLVLSGCVATTPTPEKEPIVDASLPVITLTNNGVVTDMKAIAFEWKSLQDPRVKGIYVYKKKSDVNSSSSDYYKTLDNRFITHYLDENINPDTKYSYYFKTFSNKAESKQSKNIVVNSLPILNSVSWIHSLQEMPRSVKILWRPHTNQKVKAYILERKTLEEDEWSHLVTIEGRLSAEYIDDELKDNYVYKYRLRSVTYDGIVSVPSEIVKAVTKALPKPIVNIKASNKLAKKIKLTWNKSIIEDFKLYYVYRSETIDGDYELIATLHNNYHIDEIDEDEKNYFYRVSAVDNDGLISKNSADTVKGSTLKRPQTPSVVAAKLVNNKIVISWKNSDLRVKRYTITKSYKEGWFKEISEDFEGITKKKFIDSSVKPGMTYHYTIYAIDENGIHSLPSIAVEFKTKESLVASEPVIQELEEITAEPVVEVPNEDIVTPIDLDLNEI